jgi:hypothetical protein
MYPVKIPAISSSCTVRFRKLSWNFFNLYTSEFIFLLYSHYFLFALLILYLEVYSCRAGCYVIY